MSEKESGIPFQAEDKRSGTHENNFEWQKLELEKRRLQMEIDNSEASRKLESERISLEKGKERTTKLQIILPLAVSMMALMGPLTQSFYEGRKVEMERQQLKLELFKKLTSYR